MHAMIRTARPQDEQILESMPQICSERQVYVRLRALIHPRRLAAQGREETPMGETLTPSHYATFTRGFAVKAEGGVPGEIPGPLLSP